MLPENLIKSLQGPPPAVARKPRATKPPVVDSDGTVSAEGLAALQALQEQMERQKASNDWNGSRVPNAMLQPPEGMSDSKYRKTLTPLRKAGLVHTRNGMWWVLPEGREVLAAQPTT